MRERARRIQYTIRGIPPEVDRALRQKAQRMKRSLNNVVLDELIASNCGWRPKADFRDLVGQWIPDPEFDEVLAAQRRIDVKP